MLGGKCEVECIRAAECVASCEARGSFDECGVGEADAEPRIRLQYHKCALRGSIAASDACDRSGEFRRQQEWDDDLCTSIERFHDAETFGVRRFVRDEAGDEDVRVEHRLHRRIEETTSATGRVSTLG